MPQTGGPRTCLSPAGSVTTGLFSTRPEALLYSSSRPYMSLGPSVQTEVLYGPLYRYIHSRLRQTQPICGTRVRAHAESTNIFPGFIKPVKAGFESFQLGRRYGVSTSVFVHQHRQIGDAVGELTSSLPPRYLLMLLVWQDRLCPVRARS